MIIQILSEEAREGQGMQKRVGVAMCGVIKIGLTKLDYFINYFHKNGGALTPTPSANLAEVCFNSASLDLLSNSAIFEMFPLNPNESKDGVGQLRCIKKE